MIIVDVEPYRITVQRHHGILNIQMHVVTIYQAVYSSLRMLAISVFDACILKASAITLICLR